PDPGEKRHAQLSLPDLFVPHQVFSGVGHHTWLGTGWKAEIFQHPNQLCYVLCRHTPDLCREQRLRDHADGDRFTVGIAAVPRGGFDGVAYGMAEVEDGPLALLFFVPQDDVRLDAARI